MSYDLSIITPALTPSRWVTLYESAKKSCTKYSFEIIFIGPYDPPDELKGNPQVKYIKDFGAVTRCSHIGMCSATGRLVTNGLDDAVFYPDALDNTIDLYDSFNNPKELLLIRYREGPGFGGPYLEDSYYIAKTSYHTRAILAGQPAHVIAGIVPFEDLNIPDDYKQGAQIMLSKEYFMDIGGYDCRFEHLAWASHDFCYRVQRDGGAVDLSTVEVLNLDQILDMLAPIRIPIETANNKYDGPLLKQMQQDPNIVNRIKIDIDNWKESPEVWARRFPEGKPV